ncbi:MAG: ABC transporter permease [Planctomycetota bacterium]|jgi:ribose transport system permease protein|nr:ABC transporter permease [Planctomycetota bacterium]
MNRARLLLGSLRKMSAMPAILLFFALLVANSFIMANSLSRSFLVSYLNNTTPVMCIAIGTSVVIICGEIDISLGAMLSVGNVLLIKLLGAGVPYQAAVVLVLAASMAMGLLNGFLIAAMRGSSLLTTFATSTIYSGLALLIMPVPGGSVAREMSRFYNGSLLGLPAAALFFMIPYAIWKIYKRTTHGMRLYAAGYDRNKAYVSGVNVTGEKIFAFVFAGFCAGMGALAITSSLGAGDALIGAAMSMMAISAAVIGGVSLSGGYGDVTGSLFGSLFLGLITVSVLSSNVSPFVQQLASGLILLFGMLGAMAFGMKSGKKRN